MMAEKKMVCIVCPSGCRLTVKMEDGKALSVSGNKCSRGREYGVSEAENPVRTLTTTVKAVAGKRQTLPVYALLPVKTSKPIPKALLFDAMKLCRTLRVPLPVHIGDVLIHNILGTGADLVATGSINIRNIEHE